MQDDPLIHRVALTPALRSQLDDVNSQVNARTTYVPDIQKYGALDRWEDASREGNQGDCEDFAIAKYHQLRTLGWPQAALDIAICLDEVGEGHAVLVARTDQGDLVLDNRQARVWPWDELITAGYRFEKITVGGSFRDWRLIPQA